MILANTTEKIVVGLSWSTLALVLRSRRVEGLGLKSCGTLASQTSCAHGSAAVHVLSSMPAARRNTPERRMPPLPPHVSSLSSMDQVFKSANTMFSMGRIQQLSMIHLVKALRPQTLHLRLMRWSLAPFLQQVANLMVFDTGLQGPSPGKNYKSHKNTEALPRPSGMCMAKIHLRKQQRERESGRERETRKPLITPNVAATIGYRLDVLSLNPRANLQRLHHNCLGAVRAEQSSTP